MSASPKPSHATVDFWKSGWFVAHQWITRQAAYFLESAEAAVTPESKESLCAAAFAFGSFCLEAFFNSAGRTLVPHWDLLERKLSPKEKLVLICSRLDIEVDSQKPPFTCVDAMFSFRNWLAHGKDVRVRERVRVPVGEERTAVWGAPKHDMQRLLVQSTARRYLSQADDLIDLIEKKARRRRKKIPMLQTWGVFPAGAVK